MLESDYGNTNPPMFHSLLPSIEVLGRSNCWLRTKPSFRLLLTGWNNDNTNQFDGNGDKIFNGWMPGLISFTSCHLEDAFYTCHCCCCCCFVVVAAALARWATTYEIGVPISSSRPLIWPLINISVLQTPVVANKCTVCTHRPLLNA